MKNPHAVTYREKVAMAKYNIIYGEVRNAIIRTLADNQNSGDFTVSHISTPLELAAKIKSTFRAATTANGHLWEVDGQDTLLPYQLNPDNLDQLCTYLNALPVGTEIRHEHMGASYVCIYEKSPDGLWEVVAGFDKLLAFNMPTVPPGNAHTVATLLKMDDDRTFIHAYMRILYELQYDYLIAGMAAMGRLATISTQK